MHAPDEAQTKKLVLRKPTAIALFSLVDQNIDLYLILFILQGVALWKNADGHVELTFA